MAKGKSSTPKKTEAVEGKITDPKTADQVAHKILASTAEDPEESKALKVQTEQPEREAVLSIVGGVTTKELKQALEVQTEQRKLIQQFIKDNLVEDVDYGKIHVVKACPTETKQRGSCDKSYHFSKSILFKPGQEKIFSLFGITDELVKDVDAYEMLENVPGLVAYKCIMHRGTKRIGEGRGAATLAGSQGDPNSTIKKAEKRARMDACLSLGFSAYFTQDLDDPEYASQREMMNSKAAAEAERRDKDEFGLMPRDPSYPIDNAERVTLHKMLLASGFSDPDEIKELLVANGIEDPQTIKSGQAREMLKKLKNATFAAPAARAVKTEDPDDDEPETKAEDKEPEVVVDEQLKNEIVNLANSLGLNPRGNMWLMRKIAGKPFAKFETLTNEEWRRAYEIITEILDGDMDVEDRHLAGVMTPETPPVDITEPTNAADKAEKSAVEQLEAVFPGVEKVGIEAGKAMAIPANR